MTKFFRRNSRLFLLVFMAVLMIVFVIGDVINNAANSVDRFDETVGSVWGREVKLTQTRRARADATLAANLGLNVPGVIANSDLDRNLGLYLLQQEAARMGVRIGEEHVRALLRSQRIPDDVFTAVRQRTGHSRAAAFDALGRMLSAAVLFQIQTEAIFGESLPTVEHEYQRTTQSAEVQLSVIDSGAFLENVEPPTEAELQAEFDAGRDRFDDHQAGELRFGYRLPDRVRIEYVTVDPEQIVESVTISEKDALRYYEENATRYRKRADSALDLPGAEPQMIQQTYEEVRETVRETVRTLEAIQEAQKIVNAIQQDARRPWDNAPKAPDGTRLAPPVEKQLSLAALRDKYAGKYPIQVETTDWLTQEDLVSIPNLGRATCVVDRQAFGVVDAVLHVDPLVSPDDASALPVLHLGEPGPVLINTRFAPSGRTEPYQAFAFRVLEVAPSAPPASLDEVRDKVVQNVKRAKAQQTAGDYAEQIAEQARRDGLEQAVADAEDLRALLTAADEAADADTYTREFSVYQPPRFFRTPERIRNVGTSQQLHEQVFAAAEQAGPIENPVLALPVADGTKWVVVQVQGLKPLYQGEFDSRKAQLAQQNAFLQGMDFRRRWFDIASIRQRTGFVDARPASASKDESDEDAPPAS